ncbi:hypothetical protein CAPGI0001_0600 [Capnocytophaga gingivalis ATCC 33624]|nr:hypothetical protein CAPGI0001_0600 [Capnocytophaga gingivalis ATCC 33624]
MIGKVPSLVGELFFLTTPFGIFFERISCFLYWKCSKIT